MTKLTTADTLALERKNASFDTSTMDSFINGQNWVDIRKKAHDFVTKHSDVFCMRDTYFMSREEILEKVLKQEKLVAQLIQKGELDHELSLAITYVQDTSGPFRLHRSMFMPTLERQANDEQKIAFLEPARKYQILGCYAQTEVGHGSNVRGLETTATFIPETDEFEINSPTISSTKWWLGALGIVATHACVMAQLIVNNKKHGIFPIIVPVRSLKDHKPLPGVHVGDIGPKMGFNTVDNGFVNFDKVRVPRFNLLQRYINVDRNGNVTRPENVDPRVTYSTMVFVRAGIVNNMGKELAKAVTIATRYTAIRRQFSDPASADKHQETPVLDYQIVQHRLIPLIAKTYAMLAMSHEFYKQYEICKAEIEDGNFSKLKEIHAVSCGLKKWCTDTTIYGVDTCRHLCGGHGFSEFSGLNSAFGNLYPNIIWEGDNFVLAQQTARYILKSAHAFEQSKSLPAIASPHLISNSDPTNDVFFKYPNNFETCTDYPWINKSVSQICSSPELLIELLAYRLSSISFELANRHYNLNESFNDILVPVQTLSTVYSEYMVCYYFYRHLTKLPNSPESSKIKQPLLLMFSITALSFLTRNKGELLSCSHKNSLITPKFISSLESELIKCYSNARSIAVLLVDSLGIPDSKLNSSLGISNGQVYEDYVSRALENPLNNDTFGDRTRSRWFNQYIGPILKGSNKL
ncbi:putative peroxisomal acyl-coenzyme A oxidase [Smittium culicis]|uniref:Acyl-coenzyme A oxidase n=1 Tax=Smittium culicis TaxID=133412 RepID=A0A1R1XL71_9FUNG|nr:putative peroxisomal acyl-coenzyme A oxidase [Smittium culicis]